MATLITDAFEILVNRCSWVQPLLEKFKSGYPALNILTIDANEAGNMVTAQFHNSNTNEFYLCQFVQEGKGYPAFWRFYNMIEKVNF